VPNACSDPDGDGFIASCDSSLNCGAGLKYCDCNPNNAGVYPGAAERCGNGIDDDCDGLIDGLDPNCAVCGGGYPACSSSFDCSLGATTCGATSCCQLCGPSPGLICQPGSCIHTGVARTGCFESECASCGNACPAVYQPVCARLASITKTFGNACEAANASATVLHSGECLAGEGVGCGPPAPGGGLGTCGKTGTLYCRDACPNCDDGVFTCTKVGACVTAFDCPAGGAPPPCPFGTQPSYQCVSNACVATCQ
jgi:Putative metal-binding motif